MLGRHVGMSAACLRLSRGARARNESPPNARARHAGTRKRGRGSRGRAGRPQRRGGEEGATEHPERPKTGLTGQATRNRRSAETRKREGRQQNRRGARGPEDRQRRESRTNPRVETTEPGLQRQERERDPPFLRVRDCVRVEPVPSASLLLWEASRRILRR